MRFCFVILVVSLAKDFYGNAKIQPVQFKSSYKGRTVTGWIGHSVTFMWNFTGAVDVITWALKKDGVDEIDKVHGSLVAFDTTGVDQVGSQKVPKEYKGRVTGNRTGNVSFGQVNFSISSLTKNDSRSYGCELSSETPDQAPITDFVQLVLAEKPTITHPTADSASYDEGSPVNLTCQAQGNPEPDVRWIHGGYIRTSRRKTAFLIFSRIDKANAGIYICSANNSFGKSAKQVNMVVNYAASIEKVKLFTSQSWIGQTINLTCEAKGVPKPSITWIKPDGTEIKKIGATEHTANVSMKTDQDFGNYTCKASNGVGTAATKTVQVKQIKAPGSPNVTVNIQAASITVTWTKPADNGGSPITAYRVLILQGNNEIKNENITDLLTMQRYIGGLTKYTNYSVRVFARNYVFEGNASERKIRTKSEGAPAAAEIIDLPHETNETEITLKWKEAENNGATITKYTVYQRIVRDDGTSQEWIKIREIKDSPTTVKLEKGKDYEFVVTATNKFGEAVKEEGKIKRIKMLGGVPSPVKFTSKVNDGKIIFNWQEPNNNGAAITLYTVYYGKVNKRITDVSKRSYVVKVVKGENYQVVVTASNKYGESSKEDKFQQVNVPEGSEPSAQAKTSDLNTAVVAGAAAGGVLVIVGVIIFAIWWKRRKSSSNDTPLSQVAWRNGNPYDEDDGYQGVRASAAAQGLQASGRPVSEPSYAEVDMSKKKKNRRPVADEYAVVDKSKKSKKPRKRPGELDYAELDDLRPNIQPAAAESAPARPLVRPPVYEGTEYADITQFGVPQPEPTYGNMPKKDVVYSNVQGGL